MPTLLKIDVSPRGDMSYSRKLGKAFTESWKSAHAGGTVVERDLAKNQPTYVDVQWIAGAYSAPDKHTEEHKAALKLSDEIIAELKAADHILITTPMYNFSLPAVLKAWVDHAVRVGHTFSISEKGYAGLLEGKKAFVIMSAGGAYDEGTPTESYNQVTPYLKQVLGFIGVPDVTALVAGGSSGVSMGKITEEDFLKPNLAKATELAKA